MAVVGLVAVGLIRSGAVGQIWAASDAAMFPSPAPSSRPNSPGISTIETDHSPEMNAIARVRQQVPDLTAGLNKQHGFLGRRDSINAKGELVSLLSFRTVADLKHWYGTRVTKQILSQIPGAPVPEADLVTRGISETGPATVLVTLRPSVGQPQVPVQSFSLEVYGGAGEPLTVTAPKPEPSDAPRLPAARIKRIPLEPVITPEPVRF